MSEIENACNVLVGKPGKEIPLRRPRFRMKKNIKMDLKAISCEDVGWIQPAQNRVWWRALVNT
jgi:hypothetical protein